MRACRPHSTERFQHDAKQVAFRNLRKTLVKLTQWWITPTRPTTFSQNGVKMFYTFQGWHSTCLFTGTNTPGPWERLSVDWGPGSQKCEQHRNIFLVLSSNWSVSGHSTSRCWPSSASPGRGTWPSATPSTCTPWQGPPGQPGEEISQLKEENSDEIWIVFALLSIVAEVLLMKSPTPDPGITLSDRANKSVFCVNTRSHSDVITTSPHRFVWTLSKYFMKMMVFSFYGCSLIEVEEMF